MSDPEACHFDPCDPQLAADPIGFWSGITRGPGRLRAGRHAVALCRHADVKAVLEDRDGALKCPIRALAAYPPGPFRTHNAATMAFLDPPDHGPVRRRFARAFAPAILNRLEPAVHRLSQRLLADLAEDGACDLVATYAGRLPLLVIADILGVDAADENHLRRAAHAIVSGLEPRAGPAAIEAANRAVEALARLLAPVIAAPPDGSLFAVLAAAGEDPDPAGLLHNAIFLLNAGHETTTRLIAGLALALLSDPELAEAAASQDSVAEGLVEEVLRLDPPLHFVPRFLAHGRDGLAEGTLVYLLVAAANRDPQVFEDPSRLDPRRSNVRQHLAFAAGPHLCLGASLARMEGVIAARHLAAIAPRWRLGTGARRTAGRMFQGWETLPVRRVS